MKNLLNKIMLVFCLTFVVVFASGNLKAASLDDLSSGANSSQSSGQEVTQETTEEFNPNSSISDYMRNYNAVTDENMQSANRLAGPVANALGTLTGFILIIVIAAIVTVTSVDLLYIGVPILRPRLDGGMQGGGMQGGMSPMGGMGYGSRMGMGMGAMGGGMQNHGGGKKFVSDEAVMAVMQASQGQGGGMQGGGMGMPMGGYGMQAQQQQPQGGFKLAISIYLKNRMIFMVIFSVAVVVLTSSLLTDCGLNLAALLLKVLNRVNGAISTVQI